MIIAPRFVRLCGTDIQIFRGARRVLASTLGHEGVGVVAEVGEMVEGWPPGDSVVFNPVNPSHPDQMLGYTFDSLFQEKNPDSGCQISELAHWSIPHDLLSPVGLLIEPVATAIYSHDLVNGPSGDRVAVVVGDGPMALINSIVLRLRGFKQVLLIAGRSPRSRWAVECGYFDAEDVILGQGDVPDSVIGRLNGEFADVAIVCTPGEVVEQVLGDAFGYLKSGGIVDLVSAATPPVVSLEGRDLDVGVIRSRNWCGQPLPGYFELIETKDGNGIHVTSQRGISSSHLSASIELLGTRSGDFEALVTDVVHLTDAPTLVSSVVAGRSAGQGVNGQNLTGP